MTGPVVIDPTTQTRFSPDTLGRPSTTTAHWSLGLRLAFRFCFAYLGLFALCGDVFDALLVKPGEEIHGLGTVWPMQPFTLWTAAHVLRITHPLLVVDTGSGDRTFDWVQTFDLLVIALLVVAVWSAFDRRRPNYAALHKWFRLFIRFGLAATLLNYGLAKVIPTQMPFPALGSLLERFGDYSPMHVLWNFIGASPAYETFTGSAETLAGLLLILPRTTTLGAMIGLASMTNVFALNMSYDVPVKQFSFYLMLLSAFLLAPEAGRLFSFFFANRATEASSEPPLFATPRANQRALIAQVVLGAYFLGMNVHNSSAGWREYGDGQPKPSLYGIWEVQQMSIDGQGRAPLLTDHDRWRRISLDVASATLQFVNDSLARYLYETSDTTKTLTMVKRSDTTWKAKLAFAQPTPDRLVLDGAAGGKAVHVELQRFDLNKFTLLNRGFHWVNEVPFQR